MMAENINSPATPTCRGDVVRPEQLVAYTVPAKASAKLGTAVSPFCLSKKDDQGNVYHVEVLGFHPVEKFRPNPKGSPFTQRIGPPINVFPDFHSSTDSHEKEPSLVTQ